MQHGSLLIQHVRHICADLRSFVPAGRLDGAHKTVIRRLKIHVRSLLFIIVMLLSHTYRRCIRECIVFFFFL